MRSRKKLLAWFRARGRSLPWRETRDPYAVAVSEFMLQRTGTARVLEKFPPFLRAFPDFAALAAACPGGNPKYPGDTGRPAEAGPLS